MIYIFYSINKSFIALSFRPRPIIIFFFLNEPAPTEFSPLPLPDALPTSPSHCSCGPLGESLRLPAGEGGGHVPKDRGHDDPGVPGSGRWPRACLWPARARGASCAAKPRSEEHTSELQSQSNLVCRLLLEK